MLKLLKNKDLKPQIGKIILVIKTVLSTIKNLCFQEIKTSMLQVSSQEGPIQRVLPTFPPNHSLKLTYKTILSKKRIDVSHVVNA